VRTRNPFGGPIGNLLADGDFELSTQAYPGSQTGVRVFTFTGGEVVMKTETGGICRTGLRCGVLEPGQVFLLQGTSAPGGVAMNASIYVRPPFGHPCSVVSTIAVSCDTLQLFSGLVHDPGGPGDDGWCRISRTIPPHASATCLYIDSNLPPGTSALVDSAVLVPDDGTFAPQQAAGFHPSKELEERLRLLADVVRRTRQFGRPPKRPPAPRE
jgi:hypothetical protein